MKTKFAIIYSKNTGRIRYEFHPDSDEQLKNIILLDGEDILILDNSEKDFLDNLQNKINIKTGIIPTNDRYAVVDENNNVVSAIIADPSCGDKVDKCTLIKHETASPGWTYTSPDSKDFAQKLKIKTPVGKIGGITDTEGFNSPLIDIMQLTDNPII